MNSTTSILIKEILDKSRRYIAQTGLRPFLLSLPLQGPAAYSNREGIREKILKNRSQCNSDDKSQKKEQTLEMINKVVDNLTSEDSVGFVLLITEYIGTEDPSEDNVAACQHRPVAGGIVEFVDEYERALRGVWCRRSLTESVAQQLLQVMILQLVAHSFNCEHPKSTNKRTSSKLLSAVDLQCQTFPREIYSFLTTADGLNLGKHWETPEHGGNHNDSPYRQCQCSKLAEKTEAFQFWGISESRFVSLWTNRKESLISDHPPEDLVGKFSKQKKRKTTSEEAEAQVGETAKGSSNKRAH